MDTEKKIVLVVTIIAAFVFVVSLSSLYVQTEVTAGNACGCAIPIWLFIPLLSSIGLLIGTLVYYLLREKREEAIVPKVSEKSTDAKDIALGMVKMLPKDEATIIKLLIINDGKMLQAQMIKESGLNKVQVHRVLKRLEMRKFVIKTKNKKINTITLCSEIKKHL